MSSNNENANVVKDPTTHLYFCSKFVWKSCHYFQTVMWVTKLHFLVRCCSIVVYQSRSGDHMEKVSISNDIPINGKSIWVGLNCVAYLGFMAVIFPPSWFLLLDYPRHVFLLETCIIVIHCH